MRVLGKVAIGGTVASVATAGWLVAAGVFATSATLVIADPGAPQARAAGLTAFDSCPALLDWYVQRGVKDVGPYGWGYPFYRTNAFASLDLRGAAMNSLSAVKGAAPGTLDSAGSLTGTNTQEAAVDESDVAKTNGSLVARIVDDSRLVLIDVAHGEPTVTHRLQLPKNGQSSELLLLGDHVLISQQVYVEAPRGKALDSLTPTRFGRPGNRTRLIDVDISDPHAPRLVGRSVYSGQLLSLRQYGETVRVVTSTGRPELSWTYPHRGVSQREALQANRALVRRTTIADWVPTIRTDSDAKPLVACDQVVHPDRWSGAATVAVTSFDINGPTERSSVAVTADTQIAYSSADRMYLAATDNGHPVEGGPMPFGGDMRVAIRPDRQRTDLYAFGIDGLSTPYLGTGSVLGMVRDRWSLDEYGGKLRVAWTRYGRRGGSTSGITVFGESDQRLVPTGTVTGLGRGEDLQAVRWFDSLAIVVTYRQIDPLYTIDLTDPAHPKKLGALKISGYSGYLHPIGDGELLGLGMEVSGPSENGQAAVFDITDPTHPKRLSKHAFPNGTGLSVLDDPRSFSWLPESRTAVTSVPDWMTGRATLVALHVSPAGQLGVRTLANLNKDWQARTLPLPQGRVAILDSHRLRVVTVG